MNSLTEILLKPMPARKDHFELSDSKYFLQIPKEERSPALIKQLVLCHKTLALSVATKMWKRYSSRIAPLLDHDDLVSAAMIGLIKGTMRFDTKFNAEFSTYVIFWIKQSILFEISRNTGMCVIPNRVQSILFGKDQTKQNMKIGKRSISSIKEQLINRISLDATIEGQKATLIDTIDSNSSLNQSSTVFCEQPENHVLLSDLHRRIEKSFSILKHPRDREVLRMRFGINPKKIKYTLQEIADHFGLTRERIRQIELRYCNKAAEYHLFDKDDFESWG